MFEGAPEIVIQGITESGETFRPSDWAERLSGCSLCSAMTAIWPIRRS
jgi:hypothetical protein